MANQAREYGIELLRKKQAELHAAGDDRRPRRSDFSAEQVVLIKAHLGPWPRALEIAGLKPPKDSERTERRLEQRILRKRMQTHAKIEKATAKKAVPEQNRKKDVP